MMALTNDAAFWIFALPALAIFGATMTAGITSYGTKIGLAIVRLTARFLPHKIREPLIEEWSADVLTKSDGGRRNTSAFFWACGTAIAAARCSNASERLSGWSRSKKATTTVQSAFGLVFAVYVIDDPSSVAFSVPFFLAVGVALALTSKGVSGLLTGTVCGLVLGVTATLTFGLIYGPRIGLSVGLFGAFFYGPIIGFIVAIALRLQARSLGDEHGPLP